MNRKSTVDVLGISFFQVSKVQSRQEVYSVDVLGISFFQVSISAELSRNSYIKRHLP